MPVWAVVGLTTTTSRPAYEVAAFLHRNGKQNGPLPGHRVAYQRLS